MLYIWWKVFLYIMIHTHHIYIIYMCIYISRENNSQGMKEKSQPPFLWGEGGGGGRALERNVNR